MRTKWHYLPGCCLLLCALILLSVGAIPQYANYHTFADTSPFFGIPNAMDVLSNLPFALAGLWGVIAWMRIFVNSQVRIRSADFAYLMFILSILATGFGSAFYHLAPDDARLFWDRLPIALACASLLAAVHAECLCRRADLLASLELIALLILAVASVIWWQRTGDLRLYLGLQAMSILLIPIWQWIYQAPRPSRLTFAIAIAFYVVAKLTETYDVAILAQTGGISGHTIKHLLASGAAALIIGHYLHLIRKRSQ